MEQPPLKETLLEIAEIFDNQFLFYIKWRAEKLRIKTAQELTKITIEAASANNYDRSHYSKSISEIFKYFYKDLYEILGTPFEKEKEDNKKCSYCNIPLIPFSDLPFPIKLYYKDSFPNIEEDALMCSNSQCKNGLEKK